jgi:hypothetical protein
MPKKIDADQAKAMKQLLLNFHGEVLQWIEQNDDPLLKGNSSVGGVCMALVHEWIYLCQAGQEKTFIDELAEGIPKKYLAIQEDNYRRLKDFLIEKGRFVQLESDWRQSQNDWQREFDVLNPVASLADLGKPITPPDPVQQQLVDTLKRTLDQLTDECSAQAAIVKNSDRLTSPKLTASKIRQEKVVGRTPFKESGDWQTNELFELMKRNGQYFVGLDGPKGAHAVGFEVTHTAWYSLSKPTLRFLDANTGLFGFRDHDEFRGAVAFIWSKVSQYNRGGYDSYVLYYCGERKK